MTGEKVLFQNARLIPFLTEGFDGEYGHVLVEDGVITGIFAPAEAPSTDRVIDCQRMTLMPGLINLHMHLQFKDPSWQIMVDGTREELLTEAQFAAEQYLRQGFTTIRECGNKYYQALEVRDAVNGGRIPGPGILTAGKCISPRMAGNDAFPDLYYEVNTPAETYAALKDENERGVDFFKYMATGSILNPGGEPGAMVCTQAELDTLVSEAHKLGKQVAVHCHGKQGIMACIRAGVDTIEHASYIDGECVDLAEQKGFASKIVPTLCPVVSLYHQVAEGEETELSKRIYPSIKVCYENIRALAEASRRGMLTGWGTDSDTEFIAAHPGYEFLARKEAGYTAQEMLMQATVNGAKILGLAGQLGTVAKGKRADLILVDGRPEEDITCMTRFPKLVITQGKIYKDTDFSRSRTPAC